MKKQTWKLERDLRKLVNPHIKQAGAWVEPAPGGTSGHPDCWLAVDGRVYFLELKRRKPGKLALLAPVCEFPGVTPHQARELARMASLGLPVGILCWGDPEGIEIRLYRVNPDGSVAAPVSMFSKRAKTGFPGFVKHLTLAG